MNILGMHTRWLLCGALALGACEDNTSTTAGPKTDAAVGTDAGALAGEQGGEGGAREGEDAGREDDAPDCYTEPTTHDELINACTDAEKVDKQPTLPLLLADGGLPELP